MDLSNDKKFIGVGDNSGINLTLVLYISIIFSPESIEAIVIEDGEDNVTAAIDGFIKPDVI